MHIKYRILEEGPLNYFRLNNESYTVFPDEEEVLLQEGDRVKVESVD